MCNLNLDKDIWPLYRTVDDRFSEVIVKRGSTVFFLYF